MMNPVQKIELEKGKTREAVFTLRLFSYAKAHQVEIEMPTSSELEKDPFAWIGAYIDIIYTGLLVGCDRAGIKPDFDKYDVEIWATENPNQFGQVVRNVIDVLTTGREDRNETIREDEDRDQISEKKKDVSSTTMKSKVSWLERAVTRARKFLK